MKKAKEIIDKACTIALEKEIITEEEYNYVNRIIEDKIHLQNHLTGASIYEVICEKITEDLSRIDNIEQIRDKYGIKKLS